MEKHEVHNIIVTGKSGAGKQPRIDIIAETLNLKQISTGTMFRECIAAHKEGKNNKEAEFGKIALEYIEQGKFGPDELVNQMFEEYFKKYNYRGCVLDGYPRTLEQAKFLLKLLEDNKTKIDLIIEVHRDDEQIISHLVHRRTCKDCKKVYHMVDNPPKDNKCECGGEVYHRKDDTEEVIKSRLAEFKNKVAPMINFLKEKHSHAIINGYLNPWSKEKMKQSVLYALNTKINLVSARKVYSSY